MLLLLLLHLNQISQMFPQINFYALLLTTAEWFLALLPDLDQKVVTLYGSCNPPTKN